MSRWPTPLEARVLYYVFLEGPVYGLEVVRSLGIKKGSVYVILQRLEEKDLVISHEEAALHGKNRRYYWASPLGQRMGVALEATLGEEA